MKFFNLFTHCVLAIGLMPLSVLQAQTISTVAGNGVDGYSGDGGAATQASLYYPRGLTVDGSGNLYIVDTYNHVIRKITRATGVISTVAGNGVDGYSGDGGAATKASLNYPSDVAVDASGNLYIADTENNRIRKVTATGIISTVAGNGVDGYSGDGGAATGASLYHPGGVAVDTSGNLYIADSVNNRIRKVTMVMISLNAIGFINTVAGNGAKGYSGDGGAATKASLNYPYDVAIDASGNLYIADSVNNRIRKVATTGTTAGLISTVAGNGTEGYSGDGGAATRASLDWPVSVAVDAIGNLYIADFGNNRIRKVATDRTISTFAGNGTDGYSGDGGAATKASLNYPFHVAVDASGNLYIADTHDHRIRKVGDIN